MTFLKKKVIRIVQLFERKSGIQKENSGYDQLKKYESNRIQVQHIELVLRIHDILGWIRIRIRIRGSMPLTTGSGSCIRILPFWSYTFKMLAKINFFYTIFSAYYFLKLNFHHFSKIKSQKESQNSKNKRFSYYFCMMIEGSGSGSRAGSGSRRPKNMWIRWIRIRIRIRIRNTA
jgi:hypothetical protein